MNQILIKNGYEYEVIILEDQYPIYKVMVNYKGFNQHLALWLSEDINEAIDKAIEEFISNMRLNS